MNHISTLLVFQLLILFIVPVSILVWPEFSILLGTLAFMSLGIGILLLIDSKMNDRLIEQIVSQGRSKGND